MRADLHERLTQLDAQRAEADRLRQESQQMKDDAELWENSALQQYRDAEDAERRKREAEEAESSRKEAEETFHKYDSNSDGFVDISELQTRSLFDKDRNGEVSIEEATFFLAENNQLPLEDFVERAWPLIKPYLMIGENVFRPPATPELDDMHQAEAEEDSEDHSEHHEDEGNEEESEDEELNENEEETTEEQESGEEHTQPTPQYDEETQRLVNTATDARNHFAQAEKAVRDLDSEIEKVKGMLDKDYGPQEEFATLAGQCLEYNDREYIYKLCPFEKATQQPKNGGGDTNLGTWSEWVGGEDKYSAMMYSNGISCWNGPDRSTRVNINCGLENRITSVSEPNRCEYVFELETPAACIDNEIEASNGRSSHDEL